MLPLLGVLGIRARDLVGFTFLQFVFHLPVVLLMLWLLGTTFEFVPPVTPSERGELNEWTQAGTRLTSGSSSSPMSLTGKVLEREIMVPPVTRSSPRTWFAERAFGLEWWRIRMGVDVIDA